MRRLILFLLLAATAHAQSWHGHAVQPGSTTPQCLAQSLPDGIGFEDCSLYARQFPASYLEKQTFEIWVPKGYKVPGPGRQFYWLSGALAAATVFDEEEAQRLFHQAPLCGPQGCVSYKEADPLLGQTRAQAYSVLGGVLVLDYFLCRHEARVEALRTQVGLPRYRTRFWSIVSDYQTPLVLAIAQHVAFGIKQSYRVQ
jgi:hypothetical protein